MFWSIDTDARGACCALYGLTLVDLADCAARPDLADEVLRRFASPDGCRYRREHGGDEWSTAGAERHREERAAALRAGTVRRTIRTLMDTVCAAGRCDASGLDLPAFPTLYPEPWAMDCEEFGSMGATAAHVAIERRPELARILLPIEVAIIQPKDHGMAHAVTRLGGKWCDFSVKFTMKAPAPVEGLSWYDYWTLHGEVAALEVHPPKFSIWRPRS